MLSADLGEYLYQPQFTTHDRSDDKLGEGTRISLPSSIIRLGSDPRFVARREFGAKKSSAHVEGVVVSRVMCRVPLRWKDQAESHEPLVTPRKYAPVRLDTERNHILADYGTR